MKIIVRLKLLVRISLIYGVVVNLILFPINLRAFELSGDTTTQMNSIINHFGSQLNKLKQQQSQSRAQMLALQQALPIMESYIPSAPISSEMFPGCALPLEDQQPPKVCESLASFHHAVFAQQMVDLSQQHTRYMDIMIDGTSEAYGNKAGVACMEDAMKRTSQLIQSKLNLLQDLKNEYNKDIQIVKQNLQPALDKMGDLHYEIAGGNPKNDKQKSFTLEKLFTGTNCQGIIDAGVYKSGEGIRGIKNALTKPIKDGKSLYGLSSNVVSDQNRIRTQVNNQISKIKEALANYGPGNFDPSTVNIGGGGQTIYKEMILAIKAKQADIKRRHTQIKEQLAKDFPGYELPEMDKQFGSTIADFAGEAESYFYKKSVHDCVTKADSTGIGLTNEQVISMLYIPSQGNSQTLRSYKAQLQAILEDNNTFMADKLEQIAALDQKYSGLVSMKGSYKDQAKGTARTPYAVYSTIIKKCQDKVKATTSGTTKAGTSAGTSQIKKVQQAEDLVNEIKNLEANFVSDLEDEIRDRVINCGDGSSQTSDSCDADSMIPSADGFCLSNALNCAGRVTSCQALAEKKINERISKIKQVATVYNNNVLAFTANTETKLTSYKAKVFQGLQSLTNIFPDVKIPLPEDLFVKLPKKQDSEFGVKLYGKGDGNFDFMQELPDNIDKLMQSFKLADKQMQKSSLEYIAKKKEALQKTKDRWENFGQTCTQKMAQLLAAQKESDEKQQQQQLDQWEQQKEMIAEKEAFCKKYHGLSGLNPGPGCDNTVDELSDDLAKVGNFLADADHVQYNLNQYRNLCDSINNAKEAEKKGTDKLNIAQICAEHSFNWEQVKEQLISDLEARLPDDADLRGYLEDASDDSSDKDKKKGKKSKKSKAGSIFSHVGRGDDEDDDDVGFIGNPVYDLKAAMLKKLIIAAETYSDDDPSNTRLEDYQEAVDKLISGKGVDKSDVDSKLKTIEKNINQLGDDNANKQKLLKTLEEAKSAAENKNFDEVATKLGTLTSNDGIKDAGDAKSLAESLKKKIDKKLETKDKDDEYISDLKALKKKFLGSTKDEEADLDPCNLVQREIVMNLIDSCKSDDDISGCYKDDEEEALTKANGMGYPAKMFNMALEKYEVQSIDPTDSEIWSGMGENIRGTCIGEDDRQRVMKQMQESGGSPYDYLTDPSSTFGR